MTGSFLLQAIGMPSSGEWIVLLVVGLLIFGRRLPEVGKSVAKTLSQFRRGLHDFKRELDKDEDLKEVKSTVHEFKKAVDTPRILANPGKILDSFEVDDDEQEDLGPTAPPKVPAKTPAKTIESKSSEPSPPAPEPAPEVEESDPR